MAEKKIIAVVGATGAQGGGLARAILADSSGGFAARALTRKPDSDKAKELAARGAEVVACDLDDPGSVERAFAGADAAYCVTNYWEHFSVDRELAQVRDVDDLGPLSKNRLTTVGDLKVPALRVLDKSSLLQVSPSPTEAVVEDLLVSTR